MKGEPTPPETERRGAQRRLDRMTSAEVLRAMNEEDRLVADAVGEALEEISRVVERACEALSGGGRLVYVGAGTSGRIAYADAAECPPTFGIRPGRVLALIAGGERALAGEREDAEDDAGAGRGDLARLDPGPGDLVVGISASGGTPYTLAALAEAKERGATTAAVVNARGSAMGRRVDLPVEVPTGAEVLAGSTRLKAGTAQKMVLNMISTATMARLGYVYDDLMVGLVPSNAKLISRAARAVEEISGRPRADAEAALVRAERSVPVAVLLLDGAPTPAEARRLLEGAGGSLRRARDEAVALYGGDIRG